MAIIECGFPAGLSLPGSPNSLSAQAALVWRGPTIQVDIGFDPAMFGTALPPVPGGSAPPLAIPAVQVPALLDTGATESSIDETLAQQLQLPLIDKANSAGIGGIITLNIYLANIIIPGLAVQYGRFTGVHLHAGGQHHRALIGRSLLKDALLVYDGRSGSVKLAR